MPPTKIKQPPSKRRRRDPATGRFLSATSTSAPSPQDQTRATNASPSLTFTPKSTNSAAMGGSTSAPKRKREEEDEEASEQESAVERVFCINELVEEILSYLSPAELLRAQAVKQTFQAVYKGSKQLQLKTFESIHGTSKQVQPLEINLLLVQWVQDNEERQVRDYGVIVAPPSMPHVCFSEGYGEGSGEGCGGSRMLRVWFHVDNGEQVEIDHTKSWMKQHIYDAGLSITVEVHCGVKLLKHITDQIVLLNLYAYVKVRNCALGRLLEIAKKLKQLSDFGYLDDEENEDGDACFDLGQNPHWLANVPPELMELMEGDLMLTSVLA